MALLTIRDSSLGVITWEPPVSSEAERVLELAVGRELLGTEIKRFLFLLDGSLKSGRLRTRHLHELSELLTMLAKLQLGRLKKAEQN